MDPVPKRTYKKRDPDAPKTQVYETTKNITKCSGIATEGICTSTRGTGQTKAQIYEATKGITEI